jgi:hypothetical protein
MFHELKRENILDFAEQDAFSEDWDRLGLDDRDLQLLQNTIMASPRSPPVIQGTGGLRKLRFKPPGWNVGKSGAVRVCYVHFPEHTLAYLVMAYAKSDKDDLAPAQRAAFRSVIERLRKGLAQRVYRDGANRNLR